MPCLVTPYDLRPRNGMGLTSLFWKAGWNLMALSTQFRLHRAFKLELYCKY